MNDRRFTADRSEIAVDGCKLLVNHFCGHDSGSSNSFISCTVQRWIRKLCRLCPRSSPGSRASTDQLRAKPGSMHYSSAFITSSPVVSGSVRNVVCTEGIHCHCALLRALICCHLWLSCWWTWASQRRFCMHILFPAEMVAVISPVALDNDRLMKCELPLTKYIWLNINVPP